MIDRTTAGIVHTIDFHSHAEPLVNFPWQEIFRRDEAKKSTIVDESGDSDLSDLIPRISRLLGWLAQGRTIEHIGMRMTIILWLYRPDLIKGQTLEQLCNGTTRQNINVTAVEFRKAFGVRQSVKQIAKLRGSSINGNGKHAGGLENEPESPM